jgi:hypothetical protein
MIYEIDKCRICGNTNLEEVLDLGEQALTGTFPRTIDQKVSIGPLKLVKCHGEDSCGLLQLKHTHSLGEMYGDNYGYRSGLNQSMVAHLQKKVKKILDFVKLEKNDLIVDIGSNDGTTLRNYPNNELMLVGIDPTGSKFKEYYPSHITLIPDFFGAEIFIKYFEEKKAKVITSFSMFYDLENPMQFMGEIFEILDDNGIWVFEQSYMPTMLEQNSYDTVCHEHLEYYALKQIKWMTDRVGLKIVDIEFNEVNGGSFSITAAKKDSIYPTAQKLIDEVLQGEQEKELDTLTPYNGFKQKALSSKAEITAFFSNIKENGQSVDVLGASTKGNVILQFCDITTDDVQAIGEVNQDKYGSFSPGSLIPIFPENEVLEKNADYLFILPWHFRDFFENSDKLKNRTLVFPLPQLDIVEL